MRKTSNLLIREGSKKSARDNNPQATTNTSFKSRLSKDSKRPSAYQQFDAQKEMIKAQNLTQKEQQQIQIEARKTVSKKIKMSENKIQSEIVSMLEGECSKLGSQLEREKLENERLRMEVQKLRKNIQVLNEKLEKAYNERTNLSKNQIDGKIQNKQLSEELNNLRNALKRKQGQVEHMHTQKQIIVGSMKTQIQQLKATIQKLNQNNKNLLEEKEEVQEELQQKTKEAQYLRENFELKKKQWDTQKRQMQAELKTNIQRKGQKITKIQVDSQKLQEKLKQQETVRKKLVEKNKELEKQLTEQIEQKKGLEEQIVSLKKRVNDLSILKSSNNAIMNQKITKIVEENQKLKAQLESAKTGIKLDKGQDKPILFGAEDFD